MPEYDKSKYGIQQELNMADICDKVNITNSKLKGVQGLYDKDRR